MIHLLAPTAATVAAAAADAAACEPLPLAPGTAATTAAVAASSATAATVGDDRRRDPLARTKREIRDRIGAPVVPLPPTLCPVVNRHTARSRPQVSSQVPLIAASFVNR